MPFLTFIDSYREKLQNALVRGKNTVIKSNLVNGSCSSTQGPQFNKLVTQASILSRSAKWKEKQLVNSRDVPENCQMDN